jgi:hypothetical protein
MEYIFTAHALFRVGKRKLSEEEVLEAIKQPDITFKKHSKYYAQKKFMIGSIEVVYEKTESYIKIITVYWL